MVAAAKKPCLPYPVGINVRVFRDDGRWDQYSAWWKRASHELRSLQVANITLGHWEGTDEPAYTADEWAAKADRLVEQYPDCIFVYLA